MSRQAKTYCDYFQIYTFQTREPEALVELKVFGGREKKLAVYINSFIYWVGPNAFRLAMVMIVKMFPATLGFLAKNKMYFTLICNNIHIYKFMEWELYFF